jgi:putative flippase GtrA
MTYLPEPNTHDKPGIFLRLVRDQRVAFLAVGVINTVVGFAAFVAVDRTIGVALDPIAGSIVGSLVTLAIAHVIGVLFAFVMHRRFVFKVRGHVWRDLARFESVYLVALGINAVVLPILVQLGVERIIAQAIITIATTVLSYVGHRYFSFRRSSSEVPTMPDDDEPSAG